MRFASQTVASADRVELDGRTSAAPHPVLTRTWFGVRAILGPVDLLRPLLPASARPLHFAGVRLGRARQHLDPRTSPPAVKGRAFVVTY